MRLGLFGGSFDPIHFGHLAVARAARDELRLDRLLLMVAQVSPLKRRTSASGPDRLEMVRLALAEPGADSARLEASELELRRPGPSFTIDTVSELRRAEPGAELVLVLGSDSLRELPRWRQARELLTSTTPIVAPREGVGREALGPLRDALGSELADRVAAGWLSMPEVPVSSTEVRRRLGVGESLAGLVPPAVISYISSHRLYRESAP